MHYLDNFFLKKVSWGVWERAPKSVNRLIAKTIQKFRHDSHIFFIQFFLTNVRLTAYTYLCNICSPLKSSQADYNTTRGVKRGPRRVNKLDKDYKDN